MEYWDEFTHLFFLALMVTLFVIGFRVLLKVGASAIPNPAIQELLAA